jgi:hypothetical protein
MAIVLLDEREFHAKKSDRGVYRVHRVVRINGLGGRHHAEVRVHRSDFVHTRKLEGLVRDASGKTIRRLKGEDRVDVKLSPRGVLASDRSYEFVSLAHHEYPYEIDYHYEQDFDSLLLWPSWRPASDIPVEKAVYRLTVDDGVSFRKLSRGIPEVPATRLDGDRTVQEWTVGPLPPLKELDGVPPESAEPLYLRFAPEKFKFGDAPGSLSSWDGMASWYRKLTEDRYRLGDRTRDEVSSWIAGSANERDSVDRIYARLQSMCRYVAIEIGVGGWQPSKAQDTYERRYGDCKDLSTLTIAMLDVAGIRAFPALTLTRDTGILEPSFPSSQFNHVITFVPLEGDTVWLECTSRDHVAGDLPASVEGADVLVVSPTGGHLLRTPVSHAGANALKTRIDGSLSGVGALTFHVELAAFGNAGDALRLRLSGKSEGELREWAVATLGRFAPKVVVHELSVENFDKKSDLPVLMRARGTISSFATIVGDRILLNPNVIHRVKRGEPDLIDREVAYYVPFAYELSDSVTVKIPQAFRLEATAGSQGIESEVGRFQTAHVLDADGTFRYSRSLTLNHRLVAPELFVALGELFDAAIASDQSSFSFKRK